MKYRNIIFDFGNVIGKNNELIWKLPEDLKRFKQLTTGHTIIMGRKTFESLGRVLPNRKHIVLTRDLSYNIDSDWVKVIHSIDELKEYINDEEEHFVIGGALIYNQLLKESKKMYITKIYKKYDGDAYFPRINEEEWNVVEKIPGKKDEENSFDYEFITYVRK